MERKYGVKTEETRRVESRRGIIKGMRTPQSVGRYWISLFLFHLFMETDILNVINCTLLESYNGKMNTATMYRSELHQRLLTFIAMNTTESNNNKRVTALDSVQLRSVL